MFQRICLATIIGVACFQLALAQQWRPAGGSRESNISGIALIDHDKETTRLLVVHDNKKPEQNHASILTISGSAAPQKLPLKWLGDDIAVDLESVSSIPGITGQYIVLNADGRAFHVKVDLKAATIETIRSFDLPTIPAKADFEALDIQRLDGMLVAVWAERGSATRPATIFWGNLDLNAYKITNVGSAKFQVPFPAEHVRHIAEIKLDPTGAAFVTSAADPGNDGPFESGFYFAGIFALESQRQITFAPSRMLAPMLRFQYHKVEAFTFVPGVGGGLIFGTDDENLGASILLTY